MGGGGGEFATFIRLRKRRGTAKNPKQTCSFWCSIFWFPQTVLDVSVRDVLELYKLSTPNTPEQNSHHVLNDVYNMNLNESVDSAIWRDREGGTRNKNSTEERALFFPVAGIGLHTLVPHS